MAITKMIHMKTASDRNPHKHLYNAINYILNPEKTRNGLFVGTLNCTQGNEYEDMVATKSYYKKKHGRQAYHFILSFDEGEVDAELAFEITKRFTEEYIGEKYETLFTVHDDTKHKHGHIIFNSVSCIDGHKYQYKNGDWKKYIQPIANRLCEEFGISTIDLEQEPATKNKHYKEWMDESQGKKTWADIIREDIDDCIANSSTYETFLYRLQEIGYEIKEGKYLSVRPEGKERYTRTRTLGEGYTKEEIQSRIEEETITPGMGNVRISKAPAPAPALQKWFMPLNTKPVNRYFRKGRLNTYQRQHLRKLYRTGRMQRIKYNNSYKFKKDSLRLGQLQRQTLYLFKNNVKSLQQLEQREERISLKIEGNQSEIKKLCYQRRSGKNTEVLEAIETRLDELREENKGLYAEKRLIKKIKKESMEAPKRIQNHRKQEREPERQHYI